MVATASVGFVELTSEALAEFRETNDPFEPANVLVAVFHEYRALAHDVRHAARWSDRVGHLVHGPKWKPPVVAPAAGASAA